MALVTLYLVHHGAAADPAIDPQRALTREGRLSVERLAAVAAERGARPEIVWHSGKLRTRQTAEIFWRTCNALASFSATRDLQPDDPPEWIAERLRFEESDILIAGHFPHLPRLLALLTGVPGEAAPGFPPHGVVALAAASAGGWRELWRAVS